MWVCLTCMRLSMRSGAIFHKPIVCTCTAGTWMCKDKVHSSEIESEELFIYLYILPPVASCGGEGGLVQSLGHHCSGLPRGGVLQLRGGGGGGGGDPPALPSRPLPHPDGLPPDHPTASSTLSLTDGRAVASHTCSLGSAVGAHMFDVCCEWVDGWARWV